MSESAPARRSWARHVLRIATATLLGFALVLTTVWAAAALYFDVRVAWLGRLLAVAYVLGLLAGWIWLHGRGRKVAVTLGGFGLVLAWWLTLAPSNDRDWQRDVAVLATAEIHGNQVTVRNIRNCDYRSESDFEVRHYDRTFDLDQLRTADLFMVYWGSPAIAHTMVSFGFADGEHVCFSIETRKENGESYSAVKGLFRQFELVYVVADERDAVRLRTNYRQGEEVYLYRLNVPSARVREFFLDYLQRINRLRDQPMWYSAVSQNCTTSIRTQRATTDRAPWDWRMLINGRGDELLYEEGKISTNLPLAELKARGHINARARAADTAVDFSQWIRQGVPGMEP